MLKIPKQLVDQLATAGDGEDASFVDAILRLAGSLGVATVAEGIESPIQARRVRELGCGLGQGNLISRPLSEDDVFRLLRSTPNGTAPMLPVAPMLSLATETHLDERPSRASA